MRVNNSSPAVALRQLANGFMVSQAIYVAAKLGIADLLTNGSKTAADLAQITQTHAPSLYRLLRVLVSVGVCLEDEGGGIPPNPHGGVSADRRA